MASNRQLRYQVILPQKNNDIMTSTPENNIERIKSDLHKIENGILLAHTKLLHNQVLLAEYLAMQRKSDDQKHFVSPLFRSEILMPFKTLVQEYQTLRAELAELMPVEELEQIEASVLVDTTSNNQYEKRYFPAYQTLHESAVAAYASILEKEIQQLKTRQDAINSAYQVRKAKVYSDAYFYTGLLAVFGFGLPFLLGTMIVNAIDKIQLVLKNKAISDAVKAKQSAIDQQVNPRASLLDDAIAGHPGMLVSQSIFSISKQRQALAECERVCDSAVTLVK